MARYECDCGAVYSQPDQINYCASTSHGTTPSGPNWAEVGPDLLAALTKLEAWSRTFIEKSPISAETLWREFPKAVEEARAAIAKAKEG